MDKHLRGGKMTTENNMDTPRFRTGKAARLVGCVNDTVLKYEREGIIL
jgi:hypothetical protein